jgi:hypothetical protein
VRFQHSHKKSRESNRPYPSRGLGRPDNERAIIELDLLLIDADRLVEQVDMSPLEAEQLTPSEANEAGEENQAAKAFGSCLGECPHLRDGRNGTFRDAFDASTFEFAGIPSDELVRDGSPKDCPEEPVTLRRGVRRQLLGQLDMPRTDERRAEFAEFDIAELDLVDLPTYVESKLYLVGLPCSRSKVGTLVDPSARILPKRDARQTRIHERAAMLVGLNRVREAVGVLPRSERLAPGCSARGAIADVVADASARCSS